MSELTALVLKRFEVQTGTTVEKGVTKPLVVMRFFIHDSRTGQEKGSDPIAMHAADAVSFAQLVLHNAQKAHPEMQATAKDSKH